MKDKKNFKWLIIIVIVIALLITFLIILNGYHKKVLGTFNKEIENIKKTNQNAYKNYDEKIEYLTQWTYEDILNNFINKDSLTHNPQIIIYYNEEELKENEDVIFAEVKNVTFKVVTITNFKYQNKKEMTKEIKTEKEYHLEVQDTLFPVIKGVKDLTITEGDNLNLKENIKATDEKEGNIEVNIEGEYDLNKKGTYKVKAVAIDHNGNRSEQEFTITVKEKEKGPSNPTTPSTPSNSKPSQTCKTSKATLTKRGYKSTDQNACQKDEEATKIAQKIASDILAKGYTTDLAKVEEAASIVSSYYYKGVHAESGLDYRTPYGVFVKGESSCAGATRALGLVLELMGYSWTHANENEWTHQWVILKMDGQIGFADGQVGMASYGEHPAASY